MLGEVEAGLLGRSRDPDWDDEVDDEEEAMRGLEHEVLASLHRRHREIGWKPGSLFDRAGHAVTTGS